MRHLTRPLAVRRLGVVVFLAAVAVLHGTLFWIGHHPAPRGLVGDEPMYWNGGETLAAGDTWSYESLWPPLQPVVLALVIAAGGSRLAVEVLQTLMLVVVAFLLGDLGRELSGSRVAGAVAAGLVLVDAPLAGFAHFLWPEALHMLFLVATVWILVRRGRSRTWTFAAGLLLGLTLCSKYLLWPFVLLALPVLLAVPSLRPAADRLALFVAGLVLVVAAVYSSDRLQVRGYPVVESATFNVWVGLNDRSRKDFIEPVVGQRFERYVHIASIRERNRIMWEEISTLARQPGVVSVLASQIGRQYFRAFDKDSFLTDQLPGGVLAARGRGYRDTPAAVAGAIRTWSYVLYAATLVGAVLGIAVFPARGRRWSRLFLTFIAYTLAVFLISHVKSRFRVQLLPFFFVYCGCAAAWLACKLGWNLEEREIWQVERGWRAYGFAAGAAVLFLFLAFGRSLV